MAPRELSPIRSTLLENETGTPMDVDSDSKIEATRSSPGKTRTMQTSPAMTALSKLAGSDSESGDDDAPVRIPRGKLLSRLQPHVTEDTSASEEDDYGAGAYERMKKRLMAGPGKQEPEKEQAKGHEDRPRAAPTPSSEDEDEAPVRANKTCRLLSRREKTASPPSSPLVSVRSRRSSRGLFVSPENSPVAKKNRRVDTADEDSDASTQPTHNTDLEERVKRIRTERLAKQRQERETKKRAKTTRRVSDEESESNSDGENSRRLTQQSKPTRKAGKKAMEAMVREQEKIRRGMQLTHQAKTKKRYGAKDLLARFGFNQGNDISETAGLPTPDGSSLPPSPNVEGHQTHDTPPTSPPAFEDVPEKDVADTDIETPAATTPQDQCASPRPAKIDKGKGRAPEFQHVPLNPSLAQSNTVTVQNARVKLRDPVAAAMVELSDSEDDLEVVKPRSRFPVFDRLPEKQRAEAPALLHLRRLAHLTSPRKDTSKGRKSMNNAELQLLLAQKGRQQAQKERKEKIEELRRKGIHVETEEEREQRQMEVEDMVAQFEKQRQKDLKLAKLEREEAKKNGEIGDGLVSSDDSEDEDYAASGEENAAEGEEVDENEDQAEVELSGSEEEDEEELEDETVEESNGLVDDMADEDEDEDKAENAPLEEQLRDDEDIEDEEYDAPVRKAPAKRTRNVVVDEEDESEDESPRHGSPTEVATQDDAMAAFGFGNPAPALGLTQAFAGTMANLEEARSAEEPEQDSLDFLRSLPDTQPGASFSQGMDFLVPNSQTLASQQGYSQEGPVSQINLGISQLIETSPAFSRTQLSDVPEPTQDAGFLLSRSPSGLVPPPSTVETVMLPIAESPIVERKGKLRRGRKETPIELSDVDEDHSASGSDPEVEEQPTKAKDVFTIMKKAAKKQRAIDNFNKKTSWAKDAVEEQAEESEDEYAGLGGASDEESGEEDEELAKMIDSNDIKVDERQIAAYFAEKAKKDDEKNINQLYKDIMSGNLRKRAGADAFDISDDEDEAEMRRRKKQAQFRQMTKALIADERIGKIAEDAKKAAFFKTFMDHYDDPDYDFLDAPEEMAAETSQSQSEENKEGSQDISIPDSQANEATTTTPANPLKRKSTDSQEKENRPPPHLRRTAASDAMTRKPMSFADVQHSVSELLEDPRIMVPDSQYISDSDGEEAPAPAPLTHKQPIIDRLTLSRTSTSSDSTTDASNLAFHSPSAGPHQPGFRVPSLLRRATSNFSNVSERSSSGASTPVEGGVRRGGTGRSNIHAQAREAERRAMVERVEKKRKDALRKVGKARGKRSVLSALGGGFE